MKKLIFAGMIAVTLVAAACASVPSNTVGTMQGDQVVTAESGISLRLLGVDRTEAFLMWAPRGRLGTVQIQWLVDGIQGGIDRVPAATGRATRRFPTARSVAAILTFEGELPIQTEALLR